MTQYLVENAVIVAINMRRSISEIAALCTQFICLTQFFFFLFLIEGEGTLKETKRLIDTKGPTSFKVYFFFRIHFRALDFVLCNVECGKE